jgi:hypothetical protein
MYDVDTFTSSFLPSFFFVSYLLHKAVNRGAQSKSVSQSVSGSININKAIFQVDNKQTFIQIIEKEAI